MRGHDIAVAPGERGTEQTFARACAVLDALADARRTGLRFTDIAGATGFSKATVHRLVAGLVAQGLVEATGEKQRYFLGHRLAAWGAAARDRHGIVELATPHLDALAGATGDTVYFSIRTGVLSLCVARREGTHPIRVLPLAPGDRNALGVGSASLALLAFGVSDEDVKDVLADPDHVAARERRGVGAAQIQDLVRASRERGYALVRDVIPGIVAIGLPAAASGGAAPMAAVSVATVASRLEGARLDEVLGHLREAARAIGDLLRRNPDLAAQG